MKLSDIVNGPWAITPEMLLEIQSIYAVHLRGEKIDIAKVEAALGRPLDNSQSGSIVQDDVAVISVQGAIAKKMNMFSRISGGVSSQMVASEIESAINDESVKGIILDIDSPGGTVDGTCELAEFIYQSRGKKPIFAYSDGMIASAAYWIASACDAIYISGETNPVGSIGVVSGHRDYSKAESMAGIKTTEITAGKYKRISSQYEPLTEEGRAEIQDKTDYLYSIFVDSVARNRGVSVETVLMDMADGKVFLGKQSIDKGLVDGVSSIPEIIASINKGSIKKVSGALPIKKEKNKMTKAEILEQFPDVAAEIVADAVASCESDHKVSLETSTSKIIGLVSATMGEEVGEKFKAVVESGVSAEQAKVLGIKIETADVVNDKESRATILSAIQDAAATGIQGNKADSGFDERQAAIAAMAAGGAR